MWGNLKIQHVKTFIFLYCCLIDTYHSLAKDQFCESLYIFILLFNWYLSFFGRRSVLLCVVCLKLWWFSFHIITFGDWRLLSVFFHTHIWDWWLLSSANGKMQYIFQQDLFLIEWLVYICVHLSSCEHCVCMLWSDWESKG